jgi:hypothetical protein
MAGIDMVMSVNHISQASTRPLRNAAVMPIVIPMARLIAVVVRATSAALRAPYNKRLKMSRPRASVPSQ